MNTLFPGENKWPSGFVYYPDFIDKAEELRLYEELLKTDLHTFLFQGFEARRKVASFGYDYSFDKKKLTEGKPIPEAFQPLIGKVAIQIGIDAEDFKEILLTEYPAGSVINWHRDAPPFDLIAGISLMADCTFRLRPHEKEKQGRSSIIALPVARRSLYVITGTARSDWQHSIAPVKATRYSITLRTLKSK
ncbi:MAG: alpha-ketoglutarate-dependent dioxygenase AlkB [Flavipsychrobacter sp.]|jgi:alkylated DNA repair dioxygenase AlkB|nr:alpha-ketoglutarate-dependent dioxygenase AlkB [Flavipsychrobacter sp.]